MTRKINTLMLIGLIGVPVSGAQFGVDYGRAIWGNDQIWWTPMSMALPLEQTGGSFQIFLDSEPLQTHLERSSLTALGPEGLAYFVTPELIKVRINNWQQIKASFLHKAVYSGFALGICLTCLVLGLIAFFQPPSPSQPRRRPIDGQARPVRR